MTNSPRTTGAGWPSRRRPDKLLLVDGQPGSTVFLNESYYLEAALRLAVPDKGPPLTPYDTERLPLTEGVNLPELRPYRAVVLCNVGRLSEADIARLQRFVYGGKLSAGVCRRQRPTAGLRRLKPGRPVSRDG